MSAAQKEHPRELLAAYALGALDPEERPPVEAHLGACSECRAEVASYLATVHQLADLAPLRAPPSRLKSRLLGSISERAAQPRRRLLPLVGMAAAATVAVALFAALLAMVLQTHANLNDARGELQWLRESVRQQRIVNYMAAAPGTQVVFLDDAQGGNAGGMLMVPARDRRPVLVVFGLRPLPSSQTYQVWLSRNGERLSGGVFTLDPEGYGLLWIPSSVPLLDAQQVGVTVEPTGGSPGPTGTKVLGGTLR